MQFFASTKLVTEKWLFILTSLLVVAVLIVITRSALDDSQSSFTPELHALNAAEPPATFGALQAQTGLTFKPVANPASFGYSDQPHWVSFSLVSANLSEQPAYIEIGYPLLDNIDVWIVQGNELTVFSEGDSKPFSQRQLRYNSFLFALPENNQPAEVFIRVQSSSVLKLPVKIWQREAFSEYTANTNLIMGLFFGLLLAMGLSNLFFFFTTRNLTFLFYTGYVFCLGLTLAGLHGFGYKYLWPQQVWFQGQAVSFLASATLFFAVIFSGSLLEVRRHSAFLTRCFRALTWSFLALTISALLLDYAISIKVFLVLLTITVFLIMGVAIWFAVRRISIAGYYALAWSALLISALSASLDNLGLLNINIPSQVLLVYGATIEALMLSFILAISYSRQRDQMMKAKEQALEQEREAVSAKQELIELQQRAQDELEYKVQERTLELEIALRELSDANRELEKLNTIDPLTGIRNRRHFDKRLQAEGRRSRREQTPLALAMIDIDHFKQINDQYGHSVGDTCIRHVAQTLQSLLKRPTDDVCRYGGEEFAIILPNTDAEGAGQLVEAIRKQLAETPCELDNQSISLTLSGGVASAIISHENAEVELLKLADERLYAAKQAGRNRVIITSAKPH
jgi:diguanylate cyclase (GGDEF)-like protein